MHNDSLILKEAAAGQVSLSQVFGLAKQEIEVIADLGFQLYEQGKVVDAEAIFNGLIALDSDVYYGYAGLGAMALADEKLDEAARWLTRAAELNPNDPTVHANLGETLLRQAKFNEAAIEFERALRLDPKETNPGANRARGILAGMQMALKEFERTNASVQ